MIQHALLKGINIIVLCFLSQEISFFEFSLHEDLTTKTSSFEYNDSIQILAGDQVFLDFDYVSKNLDKFKITESEIKNKNVVTIEFIHVTDKNIFQKSMLKISNPYNKKLRYSCSMYLEEYGKWVTTNVNDVKPGEIAYEIWPDKISAIKLFSFYLE